MKKLLLPTDFSANAEQALAYGIEIANRFGSTLTLLHIYQVFSTSGSFPSVDNYMKEDAYRRLLPLLQKAEGQLKAGVRADSRVERGETAPLIAEVADKGDYDLILMGTQGASGLREIFLGSNTASVMKRSTVPVLAIPRTGDYRPFRNIVLAMDEGDISHAGVLLPLVRLAQRFGAHLRVYHQDSGENGKGLDSSIGLYLDGVEHSYHYELDKDNIVQSINAFVADSDADLLCMIRRRRGFLERIFHESATAREVFHSPVPVLVLHDV